MLTLGDFIAAWELLQHKYFYIWEGRYLILICTTVLRSGTIPFIAIQNSNQIFSFSKGQKALTHLQNNTCLISSVNIVHVDTHSFRHSETRSVSLSLCSAFQSNFHSWHHGSAYLPISASVPEWVICKAMFTSTLRRFTQERACQVFELSVRSVFTNLPKGK